ncbi:aspartate-semialdehyde dehydrogenase, partial [Prochlorococcus sp. AH-716-I09]|nr:aspartate-semialdehyde dehydrogenase [Prochlorococcus sp. AH-716-I09]
PLKVAVLGSSGAVGSELLKILEQRDFPISELVLLSSERSEGKKIIWKGEELVTKKTTKEEFLNLDLVLASAGGSISKKWLSTIMDQNALLIDNSSAFRLDKNVPLVVPEVNASDALNHDGVIANPNCTTILLALVLAPLNKLSTIQRVIVSTYQSVSGAGQLAMEELKLLTEQYLQGNPQKSEVLPYSLAFNLFLHNSPMLENNYCEEEMKMVNETRKILNIADLKLSATCVRVPVLRAHSESINVEFAGVVEPKDALEELKKSPGIEIIEDYKNNRFPMPNDVMGRDNVAVGRLRTDISQPNGLELWLCGDQIRKGAALNAVQIAELLIPKK